MFERSSPSYKKHVREIGLRWRKTHLLHIFYFTFGEVLLSKRSLLLICWQSQIVMELFESNALENTKCVIWLSKHKKKTPVICSICLGVVLTIIYTDICGRYDKKKSWTYFVKSSQLDAFIWCHVSLINLFEIMPENNNTKTSGWIPCKRLCHTYPPCIFTLSK